MKLLFLIIPLLFLTCDKDENSMEPDNSTEPNNPSITYNLVSLTIYDNSDCDGESGDYTDDFLNGTGGIFQIIINNDGSATIVTSYVCGGIESQYCPDYTSKAECEQNGCDWQGGNIETAWAIIGNQGLLNWIGTGAEQASFTISGTTMTLIDLEEGDCFIFILEAE